MENYILTSPKNAGSVAQKREDYPYPLRMQNERCFINYPLWTAECNRTARSTFCCEFTDEIPRLVDSLLHPKAVLLPELQLLNLDLPELRLRNSLQSTQWSRCTES